MAAIASPTYLAAKHTILPHRLCDYRKVGATHKLPPRGRCRQLRLTGELRFPSSAQRVQSLSDTASGPKGHNKLSSPAQPADSASLLSAVSEEASVGVLGRLA